MLNKKDITEFYANLYENYNSKNFENFDEYERNLILKNIYSEGSGKRILDLGAGHGLVSNFFLQLGYKVFAIEWNLAGIQNLNRLGVKASQKDLEETPYEYPDNFFDEVFWGDNIEHLFFPEKVAREIYRILKPGGRLVLSTPNHGWIVNRLYYLIRGVPRRTEGHRVPIWEWQHIRYFNKREIKNFLNHCQFVNDFRFHATERRQPFRYLSRYFPSLLGSVMVIEVKKS